MTYEHFVVDMTKPHGKILANLISDCWSIMDTAAQLKLIADNVTAGGGTLDDADYLLLFGLGDTTSASTSADVIAAGSALYPMLQSIMAGSLDKTIFSKFDQGL